MKNIILDNFLDFPRYEITSVSETKREAKKELLSEAKRLKCQVIIDFSLKEIGTMYKLWFASGIGVRMDKNSVLEVE